MRRRHAMVLTALTIVALLATVVAPVRTQAQGATASFTTEEISFTNGDVTLPGTIMVPAGAGPWPAIALVHGAGSGPRAENLGVAEAFAGAGVVTLIYDKRTEGYAANGVGGREYDLLAADALAAIALLQRRPDVRPELVGLWGLSEGAWVAPMAAAASTEIAFLVLAGAAAMPPAQQEGWRHEQLLRHAGVAGSLLETIPRDLIHLLLTTELLSEASHDPVAVLEQITQPVLAVWGELDRTGPPADSARLMTAALERAGNTHATLAFIPGANHDLKRATDDGFGSEPAYVPAYLDLITTWVNDVAAGAPPASATGELPRQDVLSWPGAADPPAFLAGGWVQLIAVLVLLLAFPIFGLLGLRRRSTPVPSSMRTPARWLSLTAWLTAIGLYPFLLGFVISGPAALGPIILGRPLPWIVLQVLAFIGLVAAVALAVSWFRTRPALTSWDRVRYQILVTGALVFVPWALYWGLLTP